MTQSVSQNEYIVLVTVDDPSVQNVQELANVWGTIRQELEDIDIEVEESYTILGKFDFFVRYDAPSTDAAFEAATILERHGFDTWTMQATPTDHFSDLVHDA